ncbi:hypothetical protein ACHQM5_001983 [Ranunculus cassubicifolius]
MDKFCLLYALLVCQIVAARGDFGVGFGGGVGAGAGGGGGGVWFGGGPTTKNPLGSLQSSPKDAYNALQVWKSAITDDPLGILKTWVGTNVCTYKGIFCGSSQDEVSSTSNTVVKGIDLNGFNLQGTLVKELSLLSEVSLIHLNSNRFLGTIPDTFRNFNSLTELDLSNNQFSGPFPRPILSLQNLIYLDLRFNNFSGQIPNNVFTMNLDAIFLNNNQFEGQIPLSLGNSQASVINLANNRFSGDIPTSFGYMGPQLKEVLFLNNQLTGCIPEGVGFLSEMEVMDVSFNSLMGHLPDSMSCLNQIEVLNFAHNQLSGVLPDLVCSLKKIINLTVSYNFFSGFSEGCSNLFFRNIGFDYAGNCIPGRDMQRPQPECSIIPGGGLNCLRIPSRPFACTAMDDQLSEVKPSPSPSS